MNAFSFVSFSLSIAGMLAVGYAEPALAAAPLRHLVYTFSTSNVTSRTVHTSGFQASSEDANAPGDNAGGPAGVADYRSGNSDTGTITVDMLRLQPDSGLVVRIAESGQNGRNDSPKLCVVYGTGTLICDETSGPTTPEENSLLFLLGRSFVNAAEIDAHNHWHNAVSGPLGETSNDYTIVKQRNGVDDISYTREVKVQAARPYDARSEGRLVYSERFEIPVAVREDTTSSNTTGLGGDYATTQVHLDLHLASDSGQTASAH